MPGDHRGSNGKVETTPIKKKMSDFLGQLHSPFRQRAKQPKHRVYGIPLECLGLSETLGVPLILANMITFLRSHGLSEAGLFRISGSHKEVEILRNKIDKVDFEKEGDVPAVASLLKQLIRDLPLPLIPAGIQQTLVMAQKKKNKTSEENSTDEYFDSIRMALEQMPDLNYDTLEYLLAFLCLVSQHKEETKMTASNLAIVWTPNLFSSGMDNDILSFGDQSFANSVTATLVTHFRTLFHPAVQPEKIHVTNQEGYVSSSVADSTSEDSASDEDDVLSQSMSEPQLRSRPVPAPRPIATLNMSSDLLAESETDPPTGDIAPVIKITDTGHYPGTLTREIASPSIGSRAVKACIQHTVENVMWGNGWSFQGITVRDSLKEDSQTEITTDIADGERPKPTPRARTSSDKVSTTNTEEVVQDHVLSSEKPKHEAKPAKLVSKRSTGKLVSERPVDTLKVAPKGKVLAKSDSVTNLLEDRIASPTMDEVGTDISQMKRTAKELAKTIREFQNEFQAKHGRKPDKSERKPIASQVREYKRLRAILNGNEWFMRFFKANQSTEHKEKKENELSPDTTPAKTPTEGEHGDRTVLTTRPEPEQTEKLVEREATRKEDSITEVKEISKKEPLERSSKRDTFKEILEVPHKKSHNEEPPPARENRKQNPKSPTRKNVADRSHTIENSQSSKPVSPSKEQVLSAPAALLRSKKRNPSDNISPHASPERPNRSPDRRRKKSENDTGSPTKKQIDFLKVEEAEKPAMDALQIAEAKLEVARSAADRPYDIMEMTHAEVVQEKKDVKAVLAEFDRDFFDRNGYQPHHSDKLPLRALYRRYTSLKDLIKKYSAADDLATSQNTVNRSVKQKSTVKGETKDVSNKVRPELRDHPAWNAGDQDAGTFDLSLSMKKPPDNRSDPLSKTVGLGTSAPRRMKDMAKDVQSGVDYITSVKTEKRQLQKMLRKFESEFEQQHGQPITNRKQRAPLAAEYKRYKELKKILEDAEDQFRVTY